MNFPNDIKLAMRDCILKVLWPKKDIISFFENNSCTNKDVKSIGDYSAMNRAEIIDSMFKILANKTDKGLGQFRAMLQSLINWSHFDAYYFDDIKKLNVNNAQQAIDHLKQLQEIRDHKLREERKKREGKEKAQQIINTTIQDLKAEFIRLFQGELVGAKRGYAFEEILLSLSKLSSLEVTEQFRANGEQIDGAIKFDGEHYIIEAKWQDKASANESVYQFAGKIEGKMYGRGLFFSIHGFTEQVVDSLVKGKAIKTVFIDGADLVLVLEELISFSDMLDKKIRAAQTKGLIYVDVITGKSKV